MKAATLPTFLACLGGALTGFCIAFLIRPEEISPAPADASRIPATSPTAAAPFYTTPYDEFEPSDASAQSLPASPPIEGVSLSMPWEPSSMLVMSVPSRLFAREDMLTTVLDTMRAASRYIDVGLMVTQADAGLARQLFEQLANDPEIQENKERIHLIPVRSVNFWARDYAPFFGRSLDGELLALNCIYSKILQRRIAYLEKSVPTFNLAPSPSGSADSLNSAEINRSGLHLASFLNRYLNQAVDYRSVPLHLDGGDFVPLGQGRALVSEASVLANGGDREYVRSVLKAYLGIHEVHFLDTLPGQSVDHLDMIIHSAGPDTLLIGAPPKSLETQNAYHNFLYEGARKTLQNNRIRLRRLFPDMRIIEVPLAAIKPDGGDEEIETARRYLIDTAAETFGYSLSFQRSLETQPAARERMDAEVTKKICTELGIQSLDTKDNLNAASLHYLNVSLDTLLSLHTGKTTQYRTYLNSVFFESRQGEQVYLLPRYTPFSDADATELRRIEAQVEAAYRAAKPNAIIEWIDCDATIRQLGALHCFTITIPAPDRTSHPTN